MQQAEARFKEHGLGLAGLSYDSPEVLKTFSQRKGIRFPLLADPESSYLKQLGLMNDQAKGFTKGVAHPGVLWLDSSGRLKEKFFEESYRDRLTANTLLGRLFPELIMGEARPVKAESGLNYRLRQSDQEVIMGSLFEVAVEFDIPSGAHLYGPGAGSYQAVKLELEDHPWLEVGAVELPRPHLERLEAIQETVPVYTQKLRLRVPVLVKSSKEVAGLQESRPLTLKGRLSYQMCTATTCLLPQQKSVSWSLKVVPLDRVRASDR